MKPSIPKGTRDFSPVEMAKRNYIFNTIRSVFANYGFKQIETPSMENLSTLMGKYGEEGDKLLFKVLNSGDWAAKLSDEELLAKNSIKLTNKVSEKGLRYDLTVPFARYVVQHRDEITFPFKRFQIQPVWRADRPQKGRYREFFQCDADVVGSDSLVYEAEMIEMIDQAFQKFGIDVVIKLNNRKVLAGIAEWIGEADRIIDITDRGNIFLINLNIAQVFCITSLCLKTFQCFFISDMPPYVHLLLHKRVYECGSPASVSDHTTSGVVCYLE